MNTRTDSKTISQGSSRDGEIVGARFPYAPRQLPIARLEDGSMRGW